MPATNCNGPSPDCWVVFKRGSALGSLTDGAVGRMCATCALKLPGERPPRLVTRGVRGEAATGKSNDCRDFHSYTGVCGGCMDTLGGLSLAG